MRNPQNDHPIKERISAPSKAEIISALTQDSSRGGLQLEWLLDRHPDRGHAE